MLFSFLYTKQNYYTDTRQIFHFCIPRCNFIYDNFRVCLMSLRTETLQQQRKLRSSAPKEPLTKSGSTHLLVNVWIGSPIICLASTWWQSWLGCLKWEDLPLGYRKHPLVTLDPGVMGFQPNIPSDHPQVPFPSSDPPKKDTAAWSKTTQHYTPKHLLPPSPNQSLGTRTDRLQGLLTMELSPDVVDAVKLKLMEVKTFI